MESPRHGRGLPVDVGPLENPGKFVLVYFFVFKLDLKKETQEEDR